MAGSGVTCGRPSPRTVDSQNISDSASTAVTSAQDGACAPGSLKPSFSSATGSVIDVLPVLERAVAGWSKDGGPGMNSSAGRGSMAAWLWF
jgi:hypothetical protein